MAFQWGGGDPLHGHPRYASIRTLDQAGKTMTQLAVDRATGEKVAIKLTHRGERVKVLKQQLLHRSEGSEGQLLCLQYRRCCWSAASCDACTVHQQCHLLCNGVCQAMLTVCMCMCCLSHTCRAALHHAAHRPVPILPGWDESQNKYMLRELLIHQELSACRHPHIVALKEVFLTPMHLAAVMEHVEGENLQAFLNNTGGRCVDLHVLLLCMLVMVLVCIALLWISLLKGALGATQGVVDGDTAQQLHVQHGGPAQLQDIGADHFYCRCCRCSMLSMSRPNPSRY